MVFFNRIALAKRFLLLISLFAVIIAIENGFVMSHSLSISKQSDLLVENKIPILNKAHELKLSVVQVQQWLTDISATRGLDGLNDGFDEAEKSAKLFKKLINELVRLDGDNGPEAGNQVMAQFDGVSEKMGANVLR